MKKYLVLLLFSFFLAFGCASYNELAAEIMKARQTGREGIVRVYPVSKDEAWEITLAVFRWEKTDEIDEHRDRNYVLTSTGMKMAAFGSVIGVWIESEGPDHTKITVITKRRVNSDPFTQLTGRKFFERFEQGMKIIKSGKELPCRAPET